MDEVELPVFFYHVRSDNFANWNGSRDSPEFRKLTNDIRSLVPAPTPWPFSVFADALFGGGKGPEMVMLPAGSFWMGSPEDEMGHSSCEAPRHRVKIPRPLALGKTAVTFSEYDSFVDATLGTRPKDFGWGRGDHPVVNVSWDDAVAYTVWLSQQTGNTYRLPTEAEWEYACRAGTETRFWSGNDVDVGAKQNSDPRTLPATKLPPNPWGLHEMYGNTLEWVQDCWHDSYVGAPTGGEAWEHNSGSRYFCESLFWASQPKQAAKT